MKSQILTVMLLTAGFAPMAGAQDPVEQVLTRLEAKPWSRVRTLKQYPLLAKNAPAVSRKLIEQFPGRMEKAQIASLALLGSLAQKESLGFLLRLVRDKGHTAMMRRSAILALTGQRDRRLVLPLLDTLADGVAPLQQAAVQVLRNWIADPLVTHRVRALMRNPRADVRRHTLRLLAWARGPASVGLIRRALKDPESSVRCEAYRTAGRRRLPGLLGTLRKALSRGTTPERIAAVQGMAGLGRKGRPAVGALLLILADKRANPYLRATIPGTLAAIAVPSEKLLGCLKIQSADRSPMVRRACELAVNSLRRRKGGAQ